MATELLNNPSHAGDDSDDRSPLHLPRKKLEDAEMDITPMIDVTFLLLIFFMVTSTMQACLLYTSDAADE
mgnify:CR=1 FL=1